MSHSAELDILLLFAFSTTAGANPNRKRLSVSHLHWDGSVRPRTLQRCN